MSDHFIFGLVFSFLGYLRVSKAFAANNAIHLVVSGVEAETRRPSLHSLAVQQRELIVCLVYIFSG